MCGFAGLLSKLPLSSDTGLLLEKMASAIIHRGPDAAGVWMDGTAGIGFSHRRLSIMDTSSHGAQPMHSHGGRYTIAFNGEIYNHLELRQKLADEQQVIAWTGHSDTETLLACFEAYGIEATLTLLHGMFAIALWDAETAQLTLMRDRLGEKPLYYGWLGDQFLFGSELKALRAAPSFASPIDNLALAQFLQYGYVPAPLSIYAKVSKVMPGHYLQVSLSEPQPRSKAYWSIDEVVACGIQAPFAGSPDEAVAQLEQHLHSAIGKQMLADVPLGAFLSGGVDSSLIVALMQAQSAERIKTFSIGFSDARFNEAPYAKEVAQHIGTEHEELYITAEQALATVPMIADIWDEPFADPSQIPTYLVSKLARGKVTVSLSGDGGDELFCGYNRYLVAGKLWRYMSPVPTGLRAGLGSLLTAVEPERWDAMSRWIPKTKGLGSVGDKLHKLANVLKARGPQDIYGSIVSSHSASSRLLAKPIAAEPERVANPGLCNVQQMMAWDLKEYLPGDILTKLDRAAMAVSLEGRAPFLDHSIVEFAWSLPLDYKFRDGQTKWPLKQVLYKYVDRSLIDRPKMGFGVPLREWLIGPLREWAEALLNTERMRADGYLDAKAVQQLWQEHLSGKRNHAAILWNVLMFQAWLTRQSL
ncbi:asparagine synthase (glutamine-hydrolyzing) [Pseudomonas shirazensis]|uniref:asparagine synthase (glutamine-hydrolyzing) n=1 Tax=Pseudomonas shirazensis TaxID=2745494 RepID=A0ABU9A5S0_9PSED